MSIELRNVIPKIVTNPTREPIESVAPVIKAAKMPPTSANLAG